MIFYLVALVFGVLDLERNCHVTMLAVALDNNTNVRPRATLVDVEIRLGFDRLRDLSQKNAQKRIFIVEVRRHENRQKLNIIILSFYIIDKTEFIAEDIGRNIEFIVQELFCFSLQFLIIFCGAGAVLAQNLSLGVRVLFQIAVVAAAATGGEHHHSHYTCQQQGYEFFQVLHKGIPPISVFVDMFLFSRKAFATIVAFLP